jgi:hypothetical protein
MSMSKSRTEIPTIEPPTIEAAPDIRYGLGPDFIDSTQAAAVLGLEGVEFVPYLANLRGILVDTSAGQPMLSRIQMEQLRKILDAEACYPDPHDIMDESNWVRANLCDTMEALQAATAGYVFTTPAVSLPPETASRPMRKPLIFYSRNPEIIERCRRIGARTTQRYARNSGGHCQLLEYDAWRLLGVPPREPASVAKLRRFESWSRSARLTCFPGTSLELAELAATA